jgi:hypothetical protein
VLQPNVYNIDDFEDLGSRGSRQYCKSWSVVCIETGNSQ